MTVNPRPIPPPGQHDARLAAALFVSAGALAAIGTLLVYALVVAGIALAALLVGGLFSTVAMVVVDRGVTYRLAGQEACQAAAPEMPPVAEAEQVVEPGSDADLLAVVAAVFGRHCAVGAAAATSVLPVVSTAVKTGGDR